MKKIFLIGVFALVSGCASVTNTPSFKHGITIINQSSPKPTIVLAHGCNGMSQDYYKNGKEIASWGYNVVLVDSFTKRNYSNICTNGRVVMPAERAKDANEAVEWILKQPWHQGKIGFIGYSHGGSTALNIVGNKDIKNISAVVAFYPNCKSIFVGQDYRYGHLPLQIHSGDNDAWTPVAYCHKLISGPTDSEYNLFVYPGATHGFDLSFHGTLYGHFMTPDYQARKVSMIRTKDFFDRHIK